MVADEGFQHIGNFKDLQAMDVFIVTAPETLLKQLSGFPKLKKLGLSDATITDKKLLHLADLTQLEELRLDLQGTKITDAGAAQLAKLKHLKWLCLKDTAITDAGIEHIRNLTELEWLSLRNTKITDNGLNHLARLTKLKSIYLPQTDITDKGLGKLAVLKNLKRIRLQQTKD